jgi:hypothetical protein
MNILERLETTAAHGADGLSDGARATLHQAVCALVRPAGGFAGLDGCSDPYFTFFGWLSLRALGAEYERDALCAYMRKHLRSAKRVEARCAELLLLREGARSRGAGWLTVAGSLMQGSLRDPYEVFLLGFLADALLPRGVPRWAARRVWRRQPARDVARLPTPQLASGLILSALAGEDGAKTLSALQARHRASGGYASAAGVPADLLATAVARFAVRRVLMASGDDGAFAQTQGSKEAGGADLAFIESCWLDDGLFGPSPSAERGDAEHTFYGLLALGTCR